MLRDGVFPGVRTDKVTPVRIGEIHEANGVSHASTFLPRAGTGTSMPCFAELAEPGVRSALFLRRIWKWESHSLSSDSHLMRSYANVKRRRCRYDRRYGLRGEGLQERLSGTLSPDATHSSYRHRPRRAAIPVPVISTVRRLSVVIPESVPLSFSHRPPSKMNRNACESGTW